MVSLTFSSVADGAVATWAWSVDLLAVADLAVVAYQPIDLPAAIGPFTTAPPSATVVVVVGFGFRVGSRLGLPLEIVG